VIRFFLELTGAYPAEGLPVHSALRPVRFPQQGEMAGQTPCNAAGSSGVEEGATAGFSRRAALRCRGNRFGF
jgi:hypothetical protein